MLKTYSRQSIIEGATMKKILLCAVALLPLAAQAGKIPMSNPDEQ